MTSYFKNIIQKVVQKFQTFGNYKTSEAFLDCIETRSAFQKEFLENYFQHSIYDILNGKKELINFKLLLQEIQNKNNQTNLFSSVKIKTGSLPTLCLHKESTHQIFEDIIARMAKIQNKILGKQQQVSLKIECQQIKNSFVQFFVINQCKEVQTNEVHDSFDLTKASVDGNNFEWAVDGLARSQRIIESMGGEIQYFAKAEKGNCFTFTLPIHESEGQQRISNREAQQYKRKNNQYKERKNIYAN